MKLLAYSFSRRVRAATTLLAALLALSPLTALAETTPALLDDFSDASVNKNGGARMLIDDKGAGSQSHATQKTENGVLKVEGELIPGRGVPAFISLVSLLTPDGKPQDLSGHEGVRIRVRGTKGILSVQVGTTDVQNFDYHTSAPVTGKRGEFTEIRLAFKDMKRGWSEQTPLNLKSVTTINLVSFGLAKDAFAYEVDEIGFY